MNIYQELFITKLMDKLWPASSPTSNTNDIINISNKMIENSFTESFFEKLALIEFESSIYNQLGCSKILYCYYEQIVHNEMKSIHNKTPSTIFVNPSNKNSFHNMNNEVNLMPSQNFKKMRKKLSLTILDFGKA